MQNSTQQQRFDKPTRDWQQCRYCGRVESLVWVHGHGQCAHCGINVEECCRGEQCEVRKNGAG